MKTEILNETRIERILRRIAYQIVESASEEKSITLIGMLPRGVWVASRLKSELMDISKLKIEICDASAEKVDEITALTNHIENRHVILVDDIINSGRSMMIVAGAIMNQNPKCLYTACLVDRKHRKYPIQSDFTGMSLATTLQEKLKLVIEPSPTIFLQ